MLPGFRKEADKIFSNEKEIEKCANLIHTFINQVNDFLRTASLENKKLIILIGENHYSQNSLFMTSLILLTCSSLGIKNFSLEGSPKLLKEIENQPFLHSSKNIFYILNLIKQLDFNYKALELNTNLPMATRDAFMAEQIKNADTNLSCLIGINHLEPIVKLIESNKNIVVLAVNTATEYLSFSKNTKTPIIELPTFSYIHNNLDQLVGTALKLFKTQLAPFPSLTCKIQSLSQK